MKPEELLPPEFRSGNSVPVERATITRARMIEIIEEWNRRARQAEPDDRSDWCRIEGCSHMKEGQPVWRGQPAEPVKMPSADELTDFMWGYADEERTIPPRHFAIAARALLAKYAQQTAATLPIFVGLDLASGPDETVRWDGESPPTK